MIAIVIASIIVIIRIDIAVMIAMIVIIIIVRVVTARIRNDCRCRLIWLRWIFVAWNQIVLIRSRWTKNLFRRKRNSEQKDYLCCISKYCNNLVFFFFCFWTTKEFFPSLVRFILPAYFCIIRYLSFFLSIAKSIRLDF